MGKKIIITKANNTAELEAKGTWTDTEIADTLLDALIATLNVLVVGGSISAKLLRDVTMERLNIELPDAEEDHE